MFGCSTRIDCLTGGSYTLFVLSSYKLCRAILRVISDDG
jgi:hypothetical protein